MTASFEFSESFARVRVGFTPDLPLAEFYGLEPSLLPEPPGNTDIGEIYEPPAAVQVGRSTVSFLFDPTVARAEVGFTPDLPLAEFYGLEPTEPVAATIPVVWRLFDLRTGEQIAELLDAGCRMRSLGSPGRQRSRSTIRILQLREHTPRHPSRTLGIGGRGAV